MSWTKSLNALLLISLSSILSFALVEASYRLYLVMTAPKIEAPTVRTMLFEQGKNFENFENFFKYFPNKKIRSVAIYTTENPEVLKDVVVEYDYVIQTNNWGLVMKEDLIENSQAIYILGDSFTEGQGADPWFYDLEKEQKHKSQLVNLGILGTGPQQWLKLADYTTKENNLNVKGIVANLIFHDLIRRPWVFGETELACLENGICPYRGSFQGIKFKEFEGHKELSQNELENAKKPFPNELVAAPFSAKLILKRSKVLLDLYPFLKRFFFDGGQTQINNQAAIKKLKSLAHNNFILNIISDDNINKENYFSNVSYEKFINFLDNNDIEYRWCFIPKDGFHLYDGHPNEAGYQVLKGCTSKALSFLTQ